MLSVFALGPVMRTRAALQFKPVRHIYQQCDTTSTRFDLVWDEQQVWVGQSQPGKLCLNMVISGPLTKALPVTFVRETDDFSP